MDIIKARPTIANVAMTLANTEYSYTLPDFTKKFIIKLRSVGAPVQICFVSGNSNTLYVNLANGKSYMEENIKGKGSQLFFRSSSADQTAEIISWV